MAVGADKTVGDGAGMLTNIPDKMFRDEFKKISKDLPKESHYMGYDFSSYFKKKNKTNQDRL